MPNLPGSGRNGVTSNTFESMVQLQVAAEGKNKMLCYSNTLTLSIHMHKAPPTQHTPPRPRVSQHAHARTAPRLGAAGGEGGQCASPTSYARGGYTYLSLVKRMCPWVRPSRASPPRTQLVHTPRRGVYSPPQARCRAHSHWLLGLSTGDGPTLRVGPPPSASLTAASPFREAACQRSVAGWGGSMSMRPITTPQPLMGSPALRGRRPTKPPGRRERAPPGPADPSGTAGDGGKAKRKEPSKRGAPPPECCPAHHPSWGRLRGGLRPFAAPPAGQTHLGWEAPWGASRPLQYSTVATGNVGTVLYSRKNNTGDPALACRSACQAPLKKGSASGDGVPACPNSLYSSPALLYSSSPLCSTVCPSCSTVRYCSARANSDGDRRALSPNALCVSSTESHLAEANVQPPAGGGASGPNKALPSSPALLYSSTPLCSTVCPSCSTVRYCSTLSKNDGDRRALSPNALCASSPEFNLAEANVPPAGGGASGPNKALPPVSAYGLARPGYLWCLPLTVFGGVALVAWLVCRPARCPTRLGPKPSPLARLSMAEAVALLLLHPAPPGPLLLSWQGDSHLAFRALRKLGVPLAWVRHSPEGGIAKIRPRLLGGGKNGRGRGRGGPGGSARGGRGGKIGGIGDVGLYYVESEDTSPQYTVRVLEHPTSKGYRVQRVDATDKATFDIALTDRRFRIPPILGRIAHVPLNAVAAAAAKVKYDELCAVAAE